MDWNALLSNPNTWKAAAGMGAAIGGNTTGGRMGQVASQYLGDIAMQGAMSPQAQGQPASRQINYSMFGSGNQPGDVLQPTPIGIEGPDEITTKQTADGTTTTVKSPSQMKLQQLNPQQQQSNLPLEAYPAQGGAGQTPFYQALLGNS